MKKAVNPSLNILFLGYGIDPQRTEAVSINAKKVKDFLENNGHNVYIYNIGYKNQYNNTGSSSLQSLVQKNKIVSDLINFIDKMKINIVHDFFVLPFSTVYFTESVKKKRPKLKYIKEIHNDAGFSKRIHTETFIRIAFNQQWMLNNVLNSFACYSRNSHLASKYGIPYLPQPITVLEFSENKIYSEPIHFCYLGHPLKKKGVFEFPLLIQELAKKYPARKYMFSFAFSDLGDSQEITRQIKNAAENTNIMVEFKSRVNPHKFFRDKDFYILPIHDEFGAVSTPNTILEAMEAGCIPIVTKMRSLNDIVEHEKNGIVVEKPNSNVLLATITNYTKNTEKLHAIRKNARKFIEQHFTEQATYERLIEIYVN